MANIMDVFKGTGYDLANLTTVINKMPYQPSMLGSMNLFTNKPIDTLVAQIEERHGKLSLLQSTSRKAAGSTLQSEKRELRAFNVPHVKQEDDLWADDVGGVRAFGTTDQLESLDISLDRKIMRMRQNHEATHEFHRVGAIKGIVTDPDGTVILNCYTDFGIAEKEIFWDFTGTAANQFLYAAAVETKRHIQDSLGGDSFAGVVAICGDDWYDSFITCPEVQGRYAQWRASLPQSPIQSLSEHDVYGRASAVNAFEMFGINFVNYRGQIDTVSYVDADECRMFPVGVQDLFETYTSPANYVETINTLGEDVYLKQKMKDFEKGIDLESQSNKLFICTRPAVLVDAVDTSTTTTPAPTTTT